MPPRRCRSWGSNRGVGSVVLDFRRQWPDEFYAFVSALDDYCGRAEADCVALALADMIAHGGKIGATCDLGLDLRGNAKALEQAVDIESRGRLVENDRFAVQAAIV